MKDFKEFTKEEITAWLSNSKNIYMCDKCPYNNGTILYGNRKPCGQFNCWVAIHSKK